MLNPSLTASLIPSLCVSVPRTMNLGDDPRLLELHDAEEDKKDEALSSSELEVDRERMRQQLETLHCFEQEEGNGMNFSPNHEDFLQLMSESEDRGRCPPPSHSSAPLLLCLLAARRPPPILRQCALRGPLFRVISSRRLCVFILLSRAHVSAHSRTPLAPPVPVHDFNDSTGLYYFRDRKDNSAQRDMYFNLAKARLLAVWVAHIQIHKDTKEVDAHAHIPSLPPPSAHVRPSARGHVLSRRGIIPPWLS